tara:strand:+ start:80 stop:478 length:399 start_codon:yes stop_codon:yes gene_type:complete
MPRKTLKQRREAQKSNSDSRVNDIVKNLIGGEDPDDLMIKILEALPQTEIIPESGSYYTFIYSPKTPNIEYDQHPLVAVTDIFSWGFKGFNYHWNEMRQYTWNEVVGSMHVVRRSELEDMRTIPYQRFRLNS